MAGKDLWVLAYLLVGLSKFFLEFGRVQIILIIFYQHTFSGTIFSGTEFNLALDAQMVKLNIMMYYFKPSKFNGHYILQFTFPKIIFGY